MTATDRAQDPAPERARTGNASPYFHAAPPSPARPEPAHPEPARAEPARAEPARVEPDRPKPDRPEPDRPEPALVGHGHEREPLSHYAKLIATFTTTVGGSFTLLWLTGRPLPRMGLGDVVLLGLAANRLSRLVSRDKVTRVIRAPFTEVAPDARPDEVKEKPRGQGMTRAVGELLTCPRCTALWAAAGLSVGYAFAPRGTRFVASMLSAAAVSDFVNTRFGHARTEIAQEVEASLRDTPGSPRTNSAPHLVPPPGPHSPASTHAI